MSIMASRELVIIDGDGVQTRASCESYVAAVELALRLTSGVPADVVRVQFSRDAERGSLHTDGERR